MTGTIVTTGILLLLASMAVSILTVGLSWLIARLSCRPKRRLPAETPADYGLPFETVTFTSHGVPLKGWFISPNGNPTPRPAVVVAHGWASNATRMLPVARLLHEAGFGVFLYDARGHGASGDGGPMTLLKFAQDLIAAVDYLAGRSEVDMTRLGVVGHSMGGSGAILATSMEPRIQALVTSSAFADPADVTRIIVRNRHLPHWPFFGLLNYFFERWLGTTMADIAPQNRVGRITVPLLLIHGDSDHFVPPTNLETLYARAQQAYVQRWLAPGRRHSNVVPDPEYGSRVTEFLDKHLS